MSDLPSIFDRMHYENRRTYSRTEGNISYLDGTPLTRPASMPASQRGILVVLVVCAIVIGIICINNFVISSWQEAVSSEQAVIDNLKREPSLESIPHVASLIGLDNEAIKATFSEAGYKIYDASSHDDSGDLQLFKIPSDVSADEAAALFIQGIGSLNAEQASRILNGSWMFAAERVNGTSMVVRYADFSTGDPVIAVQNALVKEGFDPTSISASGEDESGNTYSSGTLMAGESPCTWKVSALKLGEMYSVRGLPEDACYVGVRVTIN